MQTMANQAVTEVGVANRRSTPEMKYIKLTKHNQITVRGATRIRPGMKMINGKMRAKISFASGTPNAEMEKAVLENELVQKWLEGKAPKKVIIVPDKMLNIVV